MLRWLGRRWSGAVGDVWERRASLYDFALGWPVRVLEGRSDATDRKVLMLSCVAVRDGVSWSTASLTTLAPVLIESAAVFTSSRAPTLALSASLVMRRVAT